MTNTGGNGSRRKFASKYSHPLAATLVLLFGVVELSQAGSSQTPAVNVAVGLGLAAFAVYLYRGKGISPARQAKLDAKATRKADTIEAAKVRLAEATGGEAVVAYRNLEKVVKSASGKDYQAAFQAILTEIKFDAKRIESQQLGVIPKFGLLGTPIEIYKDWIISGSEAYDVDSSIKGEVHVDGAITYDAKNNKRDLRKASLQIVSKSWSKTFQIDPDKADLARRLVSQLAAIVESEKPAGVTAADISKMIDLILSNTGQPPAEKLKQLSDLRFQRLLSDEEFESAKAKVLGI